MFSYQQNFAAPCHPCTDADFKKLIHDPRVIDTTHRCTEAYRKFGKGAAYNSLKKKLPLMMFCCTFDGDKRAQANVRLNGLFMYDADELMEKHGTTPRELFDKIPQWLFDGKQQRHILYAGKTPSGDGLRVVCTCDPEKGNLADHQQWLGTLLGVACDKSVKDASRGSFVVSYDYIYYVDPQIFNYHNEEYSEKYNDCYRSGATAAPSHPRTSVPPLDAAPSHPRTSVPPLDAAPSHPRTPVPPLDADYHGVAYQKIVDVYCARHPDYAQGDRHPHLLKMAGRLRYIVDNSPEKLKQLVRLAQYVQEWEQKEKNTKEIDDACETACQQRFYMGKPKALQDVLARAGVKPTATTDDQERQAMQETASRVFKERLMPTLPEPYKTVMQGLNPLNVVPAVYVSGTMMCTLMTRTHYLHYTGEMQRMNPQAEVIGPPASGKSFADQLNRIIMEPMKTADEMARKAEKHYKDERNERQTSTKAQKGDAVKRPELPILYLPTNTSNSIFFRRLSNAKEEMADGTQWPLHLYMFDSELASANKGGGGGDWKEKRDLELKAFHNEETGVDYANQDSVNEMMNVYWNTVTTGTKVALSKKFTLQNINDGLCLRVAIAPMVSDNFKMLQRGDAQLMAQRRARLLSWAYDLWALSGELPIQKLVDYSWDLCNEAAKQAEERNDLVLDTLRRRAALYAVWFTVPVIAVRAIEERRRKAQHAKEGEELPSVTDLMEITNSDLDFCRAMFDSVIYWQDSFFGQMLQDAWENGDKAFIPRVRATRSSEGYAMLPQEFKNSDVQQRLNVGQNAADQQIQRWQKSGYIQRVRQGVYKKVFDFIV